MLLVSVYNSAVCQIVWRNFHCYLVTRQNPDVVDSKLACQGSTDICSISQFHFKCIRGDIFYDTIHLYGVTLAQISTSSFVITLKIIA